MSREARLVLGLAAVVAFLGAAALWLHLHPPVAPASGITLKDATPTSVLQLRVANSQGTFTVAREGEGYVVGDIPAYLVDRDELLALLTASAQVEALRRVTATPDDLALYGLQAPAAQVEASYADGSVLTLLLGAREPVSGGYYGRVAGDATVYLLEARRVDWFTHALRAYVDDQVTAPLALSSPLSALLDVTLAGGSLQMPVQVQAVATRDPEVLQAALSLGAPTHIVRGRGVYKLDQTYAVEVLGGLLGLTALDVAAYNATPAELAAFGFERPTMVVTFDLKNGVDAPVERYRLAFVQQGEQCYATRNDDGVVYIVPTPAVLGVEYDRLLVRWFLSPLLTDVRAVEIESEGQRYRFELSGATNADKRVTCNGEPFDIERFRTLYRLLVSAAHDGALLPKLAVTGEPLLRVTYHYLDADKAPDVMTLYPGDARRVYVQVNGVAELAMREMYLTRVQEALRGLWGDAPIELDW